MPAPILSRTLAAVAVLGLCASACDANEPIDDALLDAVDFRITGPVPELPGFYARLFDLSTGPQRAYLLYLPPGYDETRPEPYEMIFMFHGGGQSALSFAGRPGMLKLQEHADADDRIVVFPQGTEGITVTTAGYWETDPAVRDDLLFTEELLDHLEGELNVDTDRVFAGGFSNGGRFVHELGSVMPDRFLAIASVESYYGTTTSEPAGPPAGTMLPVFMVAGMNDDVIPYGGGIGSGGATDFLSQQYGYDSWYADNGCTIATSTIWLGGAHYDKTACVPGTYRNILQFVTVDEIDFGADDHAWPTFDNSGYEATNGMVNFWDAQ
jgi:poly(3-hydroxybutyrate) depolymerase